MQQRHLIDRIESQEIVPLEPEELPKLLEVAVTLRAEDTRLAGWIRILSIDGRIVIQEETPDGQALLRRQDSRASAEGFLERRLADYERMWDGCGCRIDYHA